MTKFKSLIPTEEEECFTFMEWVNLHPRLRKACHHTPNGGTRSKIEVKDKLGRSKLISLEGMRLKKLGVKEGVFDYFFKMANKTHHGLYIEMKRKRYSSVSEAQKKFWKECIDEGYAAYICFGADEAMQVVKNYLADLEPACA